MNKRIVSLAAWLVLALPFMPNQLQSQDTGPTADSTGGSPLVYIIPFEGEVELGLLSVLSRGFHEAVEKMATQIILEMSTPGGRVDAALEICDLLLNSKIPTAVLVAGDATSAGAIISICAEKIYMTAGSTIGTAAPIEIGEEGANPAGEKAVSYIRAKVREYADMRGRDPDICQAMIDEDMEVTRVIHGETVVISEKGKLLTLTSKEALDLGFINGIVEYVSRQQNPTAGPEIRLAGLLEAMDLKGMAIYELHEAPSERLARFVSSMAISGLLLTLGLLGIFVEIRTPGFGLPGILGILCILLVFWGHSIASLAGMEGPILFAIGIGLLIVEIFVTPGFGLIGIAGILCVLASFVFTLLERGTRSPHFEATFTWPDLLFPLSVVLGAAVAAMAAFFALPILFPAFARTPFGKPFVLDETTNRERGFVSSDSTLEELVGETGTAIGDLRPAGIVLINNRRVDVVSEGGYIQRGARVEVVRVEGRRVVVRPVLS